MLVANFWLGLATRPKGVELIPIFEKEGVLQKFTLGKAPCLLVDAKKMFEVMVKLYHECGVTMYTPLGS